MVRRLCGNRSGGLSWMCANHIREWLGEHRSTEASAEAEGVSEPKERDIRAGRDSVSEVRMNQFHDHLPLGLIRLLPQ